MIARRSAAAAGDRDLNLSRGAWLLFAWSSIGTGTVGIVVPLLPTTPFLLLAAWAAPKASPRLHHWLHVHPYFGPMLWAWREAGAVPTTAKIMAAILLAVSWGLLFWLQTATFVLWFAGVLFTGVMAFLLSRPGPRGNRL